MAFKINQAQAVGKNELYVRLYLHHNYYEGRPNTNQAEILKPPTGFGTIAVNDWPLYEGPSSDTKLVARAMGMHIQAGKATGIWQNYFNIVFEDARFQGSSLQVMGPVVERGEWAIVGGTGQFALAQGIIKKSPREVTNDGDIIELDIHAFYATSPTTVWTLGP